MVVVEWWWWWRTKKKEKQSDNGKLLRHRKKIIFHKIKREVIYFKSTPKYGDPMNATYIPTL